MLVLIFLLVLSSILLISLYVWRPRENVVARRIGAAPIHDARQRQLEEGPGRRLLLPMATRVGRTLGSILPQNLVKRIDQMLIAADQPWSLAGFLTTWLAAGIGATGIWLYLVFTSKALSPLQAVMFGVVMVPMGLLGPYTMLRRKMKARQKAIMLALPNALDLLVTCVEAGVGVDSAIGLVVQKTQGPISETFALYLRQVGLGRSRREALAYVATRSGLPDLIELASAVAQSEDLGTTIGDTLRVQAENLRMARRERAQVAAQRAPVLMTIPLTLCFLPAMGMVVVVPSIMNFLRYLGHLGG